MRAPAREQAIDRAASASSSTGAPLEWLDRALRGDRDALRALLERLAPVIQARAVRVLARRSAASGRDARQELRDMTQEVFVALLEDDARALRAWRADGGLSLENFVGLVAERQIAFILRTGRRSAWREEATDDAELVGHVDAAPDRAHAASLSRDLLLRVVDRLRMELTPKMLALFHALWVDEKPIPTVCEEMAMQPDAVYAARSRIMKRARAIVAELEGEPA